MKPVWLFHSWAGEFQCTEHTERESYPRSWAREPYSPPWGKWEKFQLHICRTVTVASLFSSLSPTKAWPGHAPRVTCQTELSLCWRHCLLPVQTEAANLRGDKPQKHSLLPPHTRSTVSLLLGVLGSGNPPYAQARLSKNLI